MSPSPLKTALKLSIATASLGLVVGCATQAEDMQARVDEAMSMAGQANNKADAARETANEALEAAEQAQETASEAQGLAKSAQYTADQNAEKIDRMFQKSMSK